MLLNGCAQIAHDLEGNAKGDRSADIEIDEALDFDSMLLSEPILRGLRDAGFKRPSPIQLKTIPTARCGVDLIVQAKSGTGKTCVFVVVALETVVLASNSTQAVILAPTREIACQIYETIKIVGRHMEGLRCACFIGGKVGKNDKALAKNSHIVVGSPGRVSQLIQDGDLSVDGVRLLVLDEADKLMEDSYQENINWIYSKLPVNKQFLVLSATYPRQLDEFLKKYMRNPQMIKLNSSDSQLIGIKQYMTKTKAALGENWLDQRIDHLHSLLSRITFSQCLIFCNFQDKVEYLCKKLKEKQWPTEFIAAHISQSQRLNVIRRLKSFRCRVLISTDLTARGIDAEHVNLVINFDIPYNSETYLHRIGRAGRFGGYGGSITLLCGWQAELNFYQMIESCKLRVKMLPDEFPLDVVANEAFYSQLPVFQVPDLSLYEQKSVVKAAKRNARSIGYENYNRITKNLTLNRIQIQAMKFKQYPLCSPEEKSSQNLKYDRDLIFRVLKRILGLPEESTHAKEPDSASKIDGNLTENAEKLQPAKDQNDKTESLSPREQSLDSSILNKPLEASHENVNDVITVDVSVDVGLSNNIASVASSVDSGLEGSNSSGHQAESQKSPLPASVITSDVENGHTNDTENVNALLPQSPSQDGYLLAQEASELVENVAKMKLDTFCENLAKTSSETTTTHEVINEEAETFVCKKPKELENEMIVGCLDTTEAEKSKTASDSLALSSEIVYVAKAGCNEVSGDATLFEIIVANQSESTNKLEKLLVSTTSSNAVANATAVESPEISDTLSKISDENKQKCEKLSTLSAALSEDVRVREPSTSDYFRSFCGSYDDYLSRVYAGFGWHCETASIKSPKIAPSESKPKGGFEAKSKTSAGASSLHTIFRGDRRECSDADIEKAAALENVHKKSASMPLRNPIKYDKQQMSLLYQYASSYPWPADQKQSEWQRITENLHIFKDWLAEFAQQTLENDVSAKQEKVVQPDSERNVESVLEEEFESEAESDENCECWRKYGEVLRKYELALDKVARQTHKSTGDENDALKPWAEYFRQVKQYAGRRRNFD